MSDDPAGISAEHEKRGAALSSVVAAVFLTGLKLVIGLLTNSLGILSEAAHSGLDLAAAVITYFAVRTAGREPDREHPYGYGKVENLSALVETLLLFITCVWIIYEAVRRLFFENVHVEASIWSFIVMGTSIIVDITRSRILMKAAKKHNSQALEADALHFSTDVWSSSVVIIGLLGVVLASWLSQHTSYQVGWLYSADAVAALGVSGIVIYVSYQLGRRTIGALVDRVPLEALPEIEKIVKDLPGVETVTRVRVRHSGPATFADVTLGIARSTSFDEAHAIASQAEQAIQEAYPRADVMVHVDPVSPQDESLVERLWGIADQQVVNVHSIRFDDVRGQLSLNMHVEVPDNLNLGQAHTRVSEFESALRKEMPQLGEIVTHIEPVGDKTARGEAVSISASQVYRAVDDVAHELSAIQNCHQFTLFRENGGLSISFHCVVDAALPISEAHALSEDFETMLRSRLPELSRVVIHLEPPDERGN